MCYELRLKDCKDAKTAVFTANDNNIDGFVNMDDTQANVASMLSVLSLFAKTSTGTRPLTLNIVKGNEEKFIKDLKAKNISIKKM